MRLAVASKKLKGKHVRLLSNDVVTDGGDRFRLNEILVVIGMYRHGIHVCAEDGRVAYHVPVHHFELAE